MKSGHVSRRVVFGALGASAVATAASLSKSAVGAPVLGSKKASTPIALPDEVVGRLVAPLEANASLSRWRVVKVTALVGGAASVVLLDGTGAEFQLDVCARDEAALVPARTEYFDISVVNQGDGSTATAEEHGLAAMALADIVRTNEHRVDAALFATLHDRVARGAARRHVGS